MPRPNSPKHYDHSHYRFQEHPATELAGALGLATPARAGYDYAQTLALKERLIEVCIRGAIRFGLPDQSRKHLGDAIGLPNEPVLRYPHREITMDPRWEKLANALRFPPQGDFPLVNLLVASAQELAFIKEALPSLLDDIDLQQRPRNETSHRRLFHPIPRNIGDKLIDKLEKVKAYGDGDTSPEGTNRAIARTIHRQMRIYNALGPAWTLVNSLESLALTWCTLPPPATKSPVSGSERVSETVPTVGTPRWNLTGIKPKDTPPTLPGLTWMWVRHEGKYLPPSWGGPQQGPWGRWEPQFPDTNKPNTSLFGHSSIYLTIDLDSQLWRSSPTRRILKDLQAVRQEFEEDRRSARQNDPDSDNTETTLRCQLFKKQEEIVNRAIKRASK